MCPRVFTAMLVICLLIPISGLTQDNTDTPPEIDLIVSPSENHKEMARAKAGALGRQFSEEKAISPEIAAAVEDYDVFYYDIDWTFSYSDSIIYGIVTMHARSTVNGLSSILLFLGDACSVDTVYNDSGRLPSSHQGELITVYLDRSYDLDEVFVVTVEYFGPPTIFDYYVPAEGMILFTYRGRTVMSNLSQPYDARDFWPCKDIVGDKFDSLDVHITVDTGLTATSNGLMISDIDNGDGTHTSHWRHRYPLPTYSVCMALSNYVQSNEYYVYSPTDSMIVENFFHPDESDSMRAAYSLMPEAIGIFADMFIEYPFIEEKYGNTQVIFGSMEHQTNTFMSNLYSTVQGLTNTLVHELAHSWWGNLITCRDWENIWLNEGFASYCEALYYEVVESEAYMHAYMADMEYYEGGSLYVTDVSNPDEIFSWRSYDKGAWVLHMLRHVVGDEAFFGAMQEYAVTYAYGSAVTEEFQVIMESHAGMDLDYFFQEWVYGTYYPRYDYAYLHEADPSGGWNTYLHITQKQDTDPLVFVMPIDIDIETSGGTSSFVVANDRRLQSFILHTDDEPANVVFDPDNWILKGSSNREYHFHIVSDTLASAARFQYYEDTVIAKGGSGQYTCHILWGDMPTGWTLDGQTGIISGLSGEEGSFTFAVKAIDDVYPNNYYDSMTYTVTMGEPDDSPGDANADGEVNVGDAVYIVNYVFKGGPPPPIANWADANSDCQVNVGDAVYMIGYIFKGGPPPQPGCVD